MEVTLSKYGDLAKTISRHLGLKMSGDITDVNTKVFFTYKSIEGRPKIVITFDI